MVMTESNFVAFLVGVVLAIAFCLCVSKVKQKDLFKIFVNKNGFENSFIVGSLLLIILSLIFDFGVKSNSGNITSAVISLVGTSLFSYLLTKRYSKIAYEDELKKVAVTAHRHNKNLLTKIEYEIDLIDRVFSYDSCENDRHENSCEYTHTLYRMRDSLIGFKRDAEESINDWSEIIPKEIDAINATLKIQKRINDLAYDKLDTEEDIDAERLEREIIKLNECLKKYQKILDNNPILKIILENEKTLAEEMDEMIDREVIARKSKSMKSPHNYDYMKTYYEMILNKAQEKRE